MITEDYISFETAKLLKEKGFMEGTIIKFFASGYNSKGNILDIRDTELKDYPRPTLQMAMKWLRERHKIHIAVEITDCFDYYWICYVLHTSKSIACDPDEGDYFKTYEEACEDAIKYCLENMVK